MKFFQFVYRQSNKSVLRGILYAFVLSFIFTISLAFVIFRDVNVFNSDEFQKQFENDLGCEIQDYQLICDDDYYRDEDFIIDLNYDGSTQLNEDTVILTKDKIVTHDREITYERVLTLMGNETGDFNVGDLRGFFGAALTIVIIFIFIGAALWYMFINLFAALVMMALSNSQLKTNFNYGQMYNLTMFVVTPYVLFNAVTRIIFGETFIGFVTSFIPFIGWIIQITFDYAIIFGLVYLAVQAGQKKTEVIE